MKLGLLGLGRMGQAVELAALEPGHEVVVRYDPGLLEQEVELGRLLEEEKPEVLIDFTTAEAVPESVRRAVAAGIPIVVGTTGWQEDLPEIHEVVTDGGGALLHAANFSVGVALFTRLIDDAAGLFARFPEYDPYLLEHHHRGKSDAPSGTAVRLSDTLLASLDRKSRVLTEPPDGTIEPSALHVVSLRAGHAFGTHEVGFDGEADKIILRHEARGRQGFARGAILASEWILGKTGIFTFDDVLFGRSPDA